MYPKRTKFNGVAGGNLLSLSTGGTFTGDLTTSRTTFTANEAVRKAWLDNLVILNYGIDPTDYLLNDGTRPMVGPLLAPGTPTLANHASNKYIADLNITAGIVPAINTAIQNEVIIHVSTTLLTTDKVIKTGTILKSASSGGVANWLRCNGAVLDQSTYPSLYSVIGNSFNINTNVGSGRPWQQQYSFNTTQTNDITGWGTSANLLVSLYGHSVVVTNSRVYLFGGWNGSVYSATVYTCPINVDGTLGVWSVSPNSLPGPLYGSSVVVTSSRVYLLGGYNNSGHSATVYTCPINVDGTLGTWSVSPNSLLVPLDLSSVVVTSSRVYLLGGAIVTTTIATVYTCPINVDGTLGTWSVSPNSLPGPLFLSSVVVTNSRVYLLGGCNNSITTGAVYTCPINVDGTLGTWSAVAAGYNLPGTLASSSVVVTNSRVYLLGGNNGSVATATVYTCLINVDGTLGDWSVSPNSLLVPLNLSSVVVTSSRVYLLGGQTDIDISAAVYTAPFLGGLNNYMSLLSGTNVNPATQFTLPDCTLADSYTVGFYSYIKI